MRAIRRFGLLRGDSNVSEGLGTGAVVVDTSVLINLLHTKRLHLFCTSGPFKLVVTPEVIEEITRPEQRQLVADVISAARLCEEALHGSASLRLYAEFRNSMGKGEAASLALAIQRSWRIASDEKGAFRRAAAKHLGTDNVLTTVSLYLALIRSGQLSVEDADQDKALLETRRFQMPFASFADIMVGQSTIDKRR